jgi:hypothetical protein
MRWPWLSTQLCLQFLFFNLILSQWFKLQSDKTPLSEFLERVKAYPIETTKTLFEINALSYLKRYQKKWASRGDLRINFVPAQIVLLSFLKDVRNLNLIERFLAKRAMTEKFCL